MRSNWGSHVLLDPSDLERMFSQEDSIGNLPTVLEELSEENIGKLDQVKGLLEQLPPREADYIELYFFMRLKQTAIAELFNVSQPTVCYRLQRGARRLRYLLELPEYSMADMEKDLAGVIADQRDVSIMIGMARTTCQSDVARDLGVTQGFVRHRFLRTIDRLERIPDMTKYVRLFRLVEENFNILKNTSRSAWPEEIIHSLV